ncbi:ATP-binding protein [Candidatus Berkelbacteria bacterium]|nr:ATP-binding protein [Candidatus Berkelbacteria bacterium]
MPDSQNLVSAKPSKDFFIDMITRDLSLTDSVLDLIDNSIDQAVERTQADVMRVLTDGGQIASLRGNRISLRLSGDQFVIEDTCGGIPIEDARNTVFLFGNPSERGAPSGLSVYGIGMKRAFFKLGRLITVRSATDDDWFVVEIDVDEWKKRPDEWRFSFKEFGATRKHPKVTSGTTTIKVARLRDEVRLRLGESSFQKELIDKVAATYSLFIRAGLQIRINGTKVSSNLPTLGTYRRITPARKLLHTDGEQVVILIIAGITPKDDRLPRGWYVFCNGRMVLEADRSRATGWGETLPQWHSKFGHFVGYVYFKSRDVRRLPWTTTKQGVVLDAPVYQTALREMRVQARPVLNFLSKMYPPDLEEEDVAERELLLKTKSTPINHVRKDTSFHADLDSETRTRANAPVNIQYKKPRRDVERIKQHLHKPAMSASSVGSYTFDYFLKQEF